MERELWRRAEELFHAALECPAKDRRAFLDRACGDNPELRQQVAILISTDEEAGSFLEVPLLAERNSLRAGAMLGRYRVEEKLGEGGMGAVFRAFDTQLRRPVALKVLPPAYQDDPHWQQRLVREARAASVLNHPSIVAVYDIGCDAGVTFIAMELVEGKPLHRIIPNDGLPLRQALGYAKQIAEALAKAHSCGVIHRDLKPSNVMVSTEGLLKVLDFGLARRLPRFNPESASVDSPGEISGTVGYMSPEQARGLAVDHRSDLFSFGVVLYEMITAKRPFVGSSPIAVWDAVLHERPQAFGDRPAPEQLEAVVWKLLEKDPANRYGSAAEVLQELKRLETSVAPMRPISLSRSAWTVVGAAAILAVLAAGWLWRQASRDKWALETAAPEIERLIDAGEFVKAAALTQEARSVRPKDPKFERFWRRATGEVSIASVPSGVDVLMRPYRGDPGKWESLGKTPVRNVRVPTDAYVWRLRKSGFADMFFIAEARAERTPGAYPRIDRTVKLHPAGAVPAEMVVVAGGAVGLGFPLGEAPNAAVDDFLIDRHEVTNEEYKRFVDAGGYRTREYWKHPFLRDGRPIPWDKAMALFLDSTGRPGPATWEVGAYPKGNERHPVGGVSWYEASAYAEFAGKSLPTAYHWTLASQAPACAHLIGSASNFGAQARPVGSDGALSGFGTTDMAGNVKEWCWNEARDGKRLILGGGFGEPKYMFSHADTQSPWTRLANFGFRCVKLDSPPAGPAAARIEVPIRDWREAKPVPDDVFKAYAALYAYDKGELNAQAEETATMAGWSRVKVTFDAGYGRERVTAYLFLPKNAVPPFQAVVYFPGVFAFADDRLNLSSFEDTRGFVMKSGRALIIPIYKGMYERRDGFEPTKSTPAVYRDHVIAWAKDLGRTLDYLETRGDIDSAKVAYFGDSIGGAQAAIQLAVERRIKAAILSSGGLQLAFRFLPEVDPFNFVTRVTIPVLMLNGRYDATFPLESSQRALFQFIGTQPDRKRHVVYEGTHGLFPRPDALRECLDWLDRYLGPVRR